MPDTAEALRHGLPTYPLDGVPPEMKGGAVAIGNFDGVHRGHAALIRRAVESAHGSGSPALVLTFDPHPRTFFRPDEPVFVLTPPPARARLMTALGVDAVVTARFDKAFSQLDPETFEENVLAGDLAARSVIVGEGFRFGRGRAGTAGRLAAGGERLGYGVSVVGPVTDEAGARVSSSAIRTALTAGDIEQANRLLGYRWFVISTVVHGEKRGRELGFPTANMHLATNCRLRHGIYAVTLARNDGVRRPGVASYGRRPQFDDGPPLLEVFVFDYDQEFYGEDIIVSFHRWIRPERKFPSVDALIDAMHQDCTDARAILSTAAPGSALDEALAGVGL
ncbi:bifunctional riboflavin kinase/FAD synthetase [Bauldia sp.]|uniref:bifunctional riboflavin kinase/FAD synthetase n=1 Tax=Bauldia sp. TaxID=2575872 RepID=UPI003BAA6787